MNMFSAILVLSLFALSLVRTAPISLDAEQLEQNGLEAQELNAVFATFTLADACTTGDVSCIDGAIANCVNGAWQAKSCAASQQCFVLPLTKSAGTFVGCATETDALSAIQATGVPGGLTPLPPNEDSTSESETSASQDPAATASDGGDLDPVTVTVTLTQALISFPPTTQTLAPSDASVLLSSLTSGGQYTPVVVSSPSATIVGNAEIPQVTAIPSSNSSDDDSEAETGYSAITTPSPDSSSSIVQATSTDPGPKDETKTISFLPTQSPTDLPADVAANPTDDASIDAVSPASPTERR